MFGQKKYKFTKEFTSPTLGNVYIGKNVFLSQSQGQKFIEAGLAEEVKEKAKVANDGRGNTGGSKGAPKSHAN